MSASRRRKSRPRKWSGVNVVEAERLARLSPGEWQLWIDNSAAQLGIPRAPLEASVKAIIAQREKDERERKAEADEARAEKAAERQRREQARKKQQEFKVLAELPEREQEARLDGLAKRLDEDPAAVREEFALSTCSPDPESVELWPEAVETAALLSELISQLRRFIVFRQDTDATAVALWIMFSWIHAVATHSPNLVVTSPEPDCGKSTLLGVLARLTPRPVSGVELTGPALYRIVDRDHPTLLVDEADDLFHRKPDLKHIVNAGWTRGTKIPRVVQGVVREFDPFCAKAIALKGMAMPDTTASRSIVVDLWPKRPDEKVEVFAVRRRSRVSGAAAQAGAMERRPCDDARRSEAGIAARFQQSSGRQLAIVAGDCRSRRRRLAQTGAAGRHQAAFTAERRAECGIRLLTALQEIFANRTEITSAELVQLLAADPDAEWGAFRGRAAISQRELAALLKPYDVRPVVLHPTKRLEPVAARLPAVAVQGCVRPIFAGGHPNIQTALAGCR